MFSTHPDRQSRRDRLPGHSHRAANGHPHRCRLFGGRSHARCMLRLADEAYPIGPAPARESYLRIDRIIEAARTQRRRGDPSRLRLPVGECRVRRSVRSRRRGVHRPARHRRSAPWAAKSAAKRLMERAGVPLVPGYHGEDQDPRTAGTRSGAHRLPGAHQGERRRRRQGHARGRRQPSGFAEALALAQARGTRLVRRRSRAGRALSDQAPPYRGPGLRRHARAMPSTCSSATARSSAAIRK